MESTSPTVPFPLLLSPIESNYSPCTIPYRFSSDDIRKATPVELEWIEVFLKFVPSFRQRTESDPSVTDAAAKAEKFAQSCECFHRACSFQLYTEILEDFKENPESHGGPPDCINNVDILSNAYTLKPHDSACCILNVEDPEIPCNDDIFPTLVDTRLDSYEAAKHPVTEIHLDNGNGILTNVAIQNQEATVYHLDPTSEIIEACAVTHTTCMKCLNKAGGFKQEMETPSCTQTSIPSQDHLDCGSMELLDPLQASSVQKEKFSDSDHDAPSFSDIEALVVLGRTTRDSEVDIDLTKESLTNKISRQQAIIELEEDGYFSIMNIGRSSVVINGKEVARGKSGRLSSRCLIGIRNMVFTFEVNSSSIKKYLSTVSKKNNKAMSSIFDWTRS